MGAERLGQILSTMVVMALKGCPIDEDQHRFIGEAIADVISERKIF